jgi:peptide/nickel transport system permease protein
MTQISVASLKYTVDQRIVAKSAWQQFWNRFRRDKIALISGIFLIALILSAVAGSVIVEKITRHGVYQQFPYGITINGIPLSPGDYDKPEGNPNRQFFLLGTDRLGRDTFVRLLYGGRISLFVAFAATLATLFLGVPLGLLAGYAGGKIDAIISRGIDTAIAFPSLLFAIGLAAVIGPGLLNIIIVISLFSWYYPARIVRNTVRSLRASQFVEAAISFGASDTRIMIRELLPHLTAPIIVYSTGVISSMILFEAGLSYLGLGVPPPAPSWGQMISEGVTNGLYRVQPWLAIVPGIMLALTTLAFNQLGDGIRDALAPKGGR